MLTVLGTVGGKTEGLVGHELVGAGVNGSSNGDTGIETSVRYRFQRSGNDGIEGLSCEIMQAIDQRITYPRTRPVNH